MKTLIAALTLLISVSAHAAQQAAPVAPPDPVLQMSPTQVRELDRRICQDPSRANPLQLEACVAWRSYFRRCQRLERMRLSSEITDDTQVLQVLGEAPNRTQFPLSPSYFIDSEKPVVIAGLNRSSLAIVRIEAPMRTAPARDA